MQHLSDIRSRKRVLDTEWMSRLLWTWLRW